MKIGGNQAFFKDNLLSIMLQNWGKIPYIVTYFKAFQNHNYFMMSDYISLAPIFSFGCKTSLLKSTFPA